MSSLEEFIICDASVLSRVFSNRSLVVEAYQRIQDDNSAVVISPTIYNELAYWLIGERGRVGGVMTKSEFDKNRNRLNKFPILNNEAVADTAVAVAKQFPDTGLGAASLLV